MAELLIEGARLPDGRGPRDVLLCDGRIAALGSGTDRHASAVTGSGTGRDATVAQAPDAERALAEGYAGRVVVGHATALGALGPDELGPIAEALARADVAVIVMPTTDLYLGGRRDAANVRRGLAPVARLLRAGVTVAYATNNVRNAFTPFGNADQLEHGQLLVAAGHLAGRDEVEAVFAMATTNAARAIGLREYGLTAGDRAHLVLFDAASPWEAIVARAEKALVLASGRIAVENRCTTTFADEL